MLKCKKENCSGCGICAYSCKFNAISMCEDREGFRYPQINFEICADCGVCNQICPANRKQRKTKDFEGYAVQLIDTALLKECASGGAFCGIANYVIDRGGTVFGVINTGKELKYKGVSSKDKLIELCGSKYYQCYIEPDIYLQMVKASKEGLTLISGTPCMVNSIKELPGIKLDNVILFEILCQGVPSEMVVNKFYSEKEHKKNNKIVKHVFRSKDRYVGREYLNFYKYLDGDEEYIVGGDDPLTLSFQRQIFLRESCYHCKYAEEYRGADFTAGDLWNLPNDGFSLERGISVLLCNSMKSKAIINEIDCFISMKIDAERALADNIPFHHPVKRPIERNISFKLLHLGISPSIITKICCSKYYIKKFLMRMKR